MPTDLNAYSFRFVFALRCRLGICPDYRFTYGSISLLLMNEVKCKGCEGPGKLDLVGMDTVEVKVA